LLPSLGESPKIHVKFQENQKPKKRCETAQVPPPHLETIVVAILPHFCGDGCYENRTFCIFCCCIRFPPVPKNRKREKSKDTDPGVYPSWSRGQCHALGYWDYRLCSL